MPGSRTVSLRFLQNAPQRVVTQFVSLLVSLEPDGFLFFKGFETDGLLLARRRRSKKDETLLSMPAEIQQGGSLKV